MDVQSFPREDSLHVDNVLVESDDNILPVLVVLLSA